MAQTTANFRGRPGATAHVYAASTPSDMVRLWTLIAQDAIVSPRACQAMREILLLQRSHDQIARYLPFNADYRRDGRHVGPVEVLSKGGAMEGLRTDAGIVRLPEGIEYVICLMNEESPDRSFPVDHPGLLLNARLSRLIFDHWWPAGVPMPTMSARGWTMEREGHVL